MSPVSVPTTSASGRSSTASRSASSASSATQVTAPSPMPARIASARPGTRSTMTTVGTGGARARAGAARPRAASARTRCAARPPRAARASPGTRSPRPAGAAASVTVNSAPPSAASPSEIVAAVQLDELAHDRQAEPGARARRSGRRRRARTEAPEDPVAVLGRHAGPESATASAAAPSPTRERAADAPADRRVADGVREQVGDDPAHALDVEARARRASGASTTQLDLAVGGQRLELLRDRPHRRARSASTSVSRASPWSALTCSSMSLICSSAPSAARRMFTSCARSASSRLGAQQLLGARDDDLQRCAQVVRELAEQPLAVVVHAREPLGQRGQLRVLAREALLDALAVGDRAALGDDERDRPSRPRNGRSSEVQRAGRLARRSRRSTSTSKRAKRPCAAPVDRLAGAMSHVIGRRPTTTASSTAAGRSPRCGPRRRRSSAAGLTSSTCPSRVEQRDEARGLGGRDLRHQLARPRRPRTGVDLGDARPQRLDRVERRAPVVGASPGRSCHVECIRLAEASSRSASTKRTDRPIDVRLGVRSGLALAGWAGMAS